MCHCRSALVIEKRLIRMNTRLSLNMDLLKNPA